MEGGSVTLNCNSDAKPPAEISWIKKENAVESGRIYSISKISSDHSGEYKCTSRNKYGQKDSDTVLLNVMYAPRNVVVILNSSAEIVEGDSVTLSCSSDSNPPALNFSWFKEGKSVGSGRIYNISKIRSDHSGEYKCRSRNKYGEKDSDAVILNVMYAPRDVVVTLNSSAEIVEGDSVTLSCSSDSNPPALNFSWFKKENAVGSGRIYSISKIRSDHSGEYKCTSRNKYGEKDSDAVMLNVMYAPRNVVVIVNSSGVIVEGDLVTLSCSSDSNPPALNFSWFKENQSSAVGSGQSFIISSINSSHRGRYYCEAQNKQGSQRSASVSVSVKESSSSLIRVTVGISAAVVLTSVILVFIIGLLIRRKRVTPSEEQKHRGSGHNKRLESPEDAYMSLEPKSRCSEYDTLDNMKRSCENTDHPEAQDPIYDSVQS